MKSEEQTLDVVYAHCPCSVNTGCQLYNRTHPAENDSKWCSEYQGEELWFCTSKKFR